MRITILFAGLLVLCASPTSLSASEGDDGTCTWSAGVMISDGTGGWYDPDIAVDGSNVHVVWQNDAATLLKYRRSTNGGASWQTIQTLAGGTVSKPHVAVSGSYVHIVWRGHEGEVGTILYRRSTDGGASFGSNVTIGTGDYRGYEPDISASGSHVYITWLRRSPDYDVLFCSSTNNGANWGSVANLTGDGGTNEEMFSRVASYDNWVYVVWCELWPQGMYGYCNRSSNYGSSWGILTPYLAGDFGHLAVAAFGSSVYYDRDESSPTQGPCQKVSTNNGAGWSTVYVGNGHDRGPEVAASGAYTGNGCTVYVRGGDLYVSTGVGTETWIGSAPGSVPNPTIAASNAGDMHVVTNSNQSGDYEIYYFQCAAPSSDGCGDADGSGEVDIDDVVHLIAYIFAGGPAPDPLSAGDADCSGGIDIDDVVYLISYIFSGGPDPCDPNGDSIPDC